MVKLERNEDNTYTVTLDGKTYIINHITEFSKLLEDIGYFDKEVKNENQSCVG
jgi:hypothetical protein